MEDPTFKRKLSSIKNLAWTYINNGAENVRRNNEVDNQRSLITDFLIIYNA